jgi:hypothetical protein
MIRTAGQMVRAGDDPADEVPDGVHRERGRDGTQQVDAQGDQLLATEAVSELAEAQRAGTRRRRTPPPAMRQRTRGIGSLVELPGPR